jgi:hypothetical protein
VLDRLPLLGKTIREDCQRCAGRPPKLEPPVYFSVTNPPRCAAGKRIIMSFN